MLIRATMGLLILAMIAVLVKMLKGPTIWDRLMSLNLFSVKITLLISLYGVYTDNSMLLDVAISYAVIGFLTITLLSRFILRGGRQK
ncbi:pH regulation protein F [Clostridium sp. D2Q-14]|uniref:monovalent cation/H+ antiporter complex subunit F n=1 Tax=Anaeromonas gelatinilytica TaxID=2683194 RepID=UPI00193AF3BE|nr:monovalent cation/H+ antiporter complex subunit F [Anaeromonas gelatinilytica]MBS4536492.1 pH regulation protein F [Anaeromonas gelatinilytica]